MFGGHGVQPADWSQVVLVFLDELLQEELVPELQQVLLAFLGCPQSKAVALVPHGDFLPDRKSVV